MPALLLGSISTVADTSELQRQAFNQAFQEHGLDWQWDQETYQFMLSGNGGQDRIASYAQSLNRTVDAAAVHETKSKIFRDNLATAGIRPRPGVVDSVKALKVNGWGLGFVTTTSAENVAAVIAALYPHLEPKEFDVIVDSTSVSRPKPDKAAYVFALNELHMVPGECVAVEDNVGGVAAAVAAGVRCLAFPNANTAGGDFSGADRVVHRLDTAELLDMV